MIVRFFVRFTYIIYTVENLCYLGTPRQGGRGRGGGFVVVASAEPTRWFARCDENRGMLLIMEKYTPVSTPAGVMATVHSTSLHLRRQPPRFALFFSLSLFISLLADEVTEKRSCL